MSHVQSTIPSWFGYTAELFYVEAWALSLIARVLKDLLDTIQELIAIFRL